MKYYTRAGRPSTAKKGGHAPELARCPGV